MASAVAVYAALALSQLVLDACTNLVTATPSQTIIGPGTTSMSVDPGSFLGSLVCSGQPGSIQSYVATVTEVLHPCTDQDACRSGVCALTVCVDDTVPCAGPEDLTTCAPGVCVGSYCPNKPLTSCVAGSICDCTEYDPADCQPAPCHDPVCGETFTLPSSSPTSCAQSAFFEYITVGSSFVAEVDAYTEPASDLVPVCGEVGPSSVCTADAECNAAFGCAGRCLVLQFETPDATCLAGCGFTAACAAGCDNKTSAADYAHCLNANCPTVNTPTCDEKGQPACCTDACLGTNYAIPLKACDDSAATLPASGGVKKCTCNYVATEGDRHMYSRSTQMPVSPEYTTPSPCGEGPVPPTAESYVNVPIQPCPALVATDGGAEAGTGPLYGVVTVIPSAALPSSLTCAGATPPGTVTGFDIVPADPTLMTYDGLACPSGAGVEYQGLVPGHCYAFQITAHVAASDAGPASTDTAWCVATPVVGVTVSAMCDPLVPVDPDAGADAGLGPSPCP
jgi:hypothetical protein